MSHAVALAKRSGEVAAPGTLEADAPRHRRGVLAPPLVAMQPPAATLPARADAPIAPRAVALATATVIALALVLVRMMNYPMRRDEQLYVPPAALLEDQALYADFFYNHVPGSAALFRAVHLLLPGDQLLASARLAVFGGWVMFAAVAAWIAWTLTRSLAVVAFVLAAVLLNDALLGTVGMTATNNFLPLPLAALGFALLTLGLMKSAPRATPLALAGLCLALAASLKASAVAFVPVAILAVLLRPRDARLTERLESGLLPLALGGLAGALPVLVPLALDPQLVLAHVVGFHTGVHVDHWAAASAAGTPATMSWSEKAMLAHDVWLGGANALIVAAALALLVLGWATPEDRGALRTVAAAVGLVALFCLVPTPAFPQYFAAPLALAPLLVALLHRRLAGNARRLASGVLLACAVVIAAIGAPRLVQHLGRATPAAWATTGVHETGRRMAAILRERGLDGRVATLAPVYALEGGLRVYPELATGQFIYRSADRADPDLRRHFVTTSPTTVGALLEREPPAALLLGFEPALERPLAAFARARGYRPVGGFEVEDRYGIGRLWLPPR